MNYITTKLKELPKFKEYIGSVEQKNSPIVISGLSDVGKIEVIDASFEEINRPICIVTYNEMQAKKIVKDLSYFTKKEVVFFPKREIAAYDYIAENKDLPYERIEVLNKIQEKKAKIIVTTIEAIMQPMINKKSLYQTGLQFKVGQNYNMQTIKENLISLGYTRTDLVEAKGEFSVRGDIIDIGLTEKKGVRIELWGDEVDSIREFMISSQRSTEMLTKIEIKPAHEFLLQDSLSAVTKRMREINHLPEDLELISSGDYISKIDKYFNCFYTKQSNFLAYLSQDFIIFVEEMSKIKQRRDNIIIENNNLIKALTEKERFVPQAIQNISEDMELENSFAKKQIILLEKQDNTKLQGIKFSFSYRDVTYYKSEIELLLGDILKWQNEKKQVIVLAGSKENSEKFTKLLLERQILATYVEELEGFSLVGTASTLITTGRLSAGYENYDTGLIVISGEELFEQNAKVKRKVNNSFKQGEKVVFADLSIGDYVVHRTHGIGQFVGVNTIKADEITKDYIKIRYRNDDMLYVPTNNLDSVRKYIGGGEAGPSINRLGSKEWENTKSRVKKNLQEVAKELIELYAKRQKMKGFGFSKDTPWQKQFEDNFPYSETGDQLRCIEEVKKDMEEPKPMDRLLCGDVGYGKTEVAIRATFKAVMDQKQVAYLVPTTVLASQQYEGFKERMEEFPIRVELLNRFRSKKEQDEVIRKLKVGEVDVVVGTHRLLSKDIEFRDLGLLIIDEEHRFGVKAKEKIKQYKESIDVLTMTATPIPRTLHMSIVGVRDMSVIYEPPHNRRPVQTYVLEYDEEVVKEAITKELERGGQAFYLFNNVEGIQKKAIDIQNLVPEAKIAVAHGKMSGNELEEIMMEFIKGEVNVLICTTILESGIDIPNANTIIVENADRLGLAQLYQIRGRVGRADKQAYAYITYKRDKLLSEVADKRLKAIKEFTEFGSGFKIAMRDLEIRGAGSMLGEIQHGHMEQVGYDTYCSLLDEVIKEMQGIEVEEEKEVQIDLAISCYIPDEYIENSSQKIEIYQDIALCKTEEDIRNVVDEMIDRYGSMPEEVEKLLEVTRIKQMCKKAGVIKLSQKKDGIVFIYDTGKFDGSSIDNLVKKYGPKIRFSPGYVTLNTSSLEKENIIEKVKEYFENANHNE